MKLFQRFCLLLTISLLGCVSASTQQAASAKPHLQPAAERPAELQWRTVSSFIYCLNNGLGDKAVQLIEAPEMDRKALTKIMAEIKQAQGTATLRSLFVRSEEVGEEANANATFSLENSFGMSNQWHEMLKLRRVETVEGIEWRIIPSEPVFILHNGAQSYVQRLVTCLAYPKKMLVVRGLGDVYDQMQALTLGVLAFAQDYDDKFDFRADNLKDKLKPYKLRNDMWNTPGVNSGVQGYSFNSNLYGLNFFKSGLKSNLVLFYSGHNQKLDFRFNGKAAVSFEEGYTIQVQFVDKEQAKNLRWKP